MCATNTLTQFFAHPFQVVQIVSHGVGEVHKNVKVQGAFGWSKDLNIHLPLLSGQKGHVHQLRRNLRLQEIHVDALILNRRNQKRKITIQAQNYRLRNILINWSKLTLSILMLLLAVITVLALHPWAIIFSYRSQRGPLKVYMEKKCE